MFFNRVFNQADLMISRDEILKGQSCPQSLESNLQGLLIALNKFRDVWGQPMIVNSGYRDPQHNAAIGGARSSAHMFCQAADFRDLDRTLTHYCQTNLAILEQCGLWMEDPSYTPTWVHLQSRPAKNRIFIP
jgi:hypothetical protein